MKIILALVVIPFVAGVAVTPHAKVAALPAFWQSPCALARPGATVAIGMAKDAATATTPAPHNAASVLRPVADVPLPGAPVRFDYQSLDATTGQLYLSHMNDGHVVAFDTRSRRISGDVPDMPRVTGVRAVPALHKLYASVTGHHNVAIIDVPGLTLRATAGPIGFPDGIAYVPGVNRVFVSDESAGGELVIDGASDTVITTIQLGGEAGNTAYDAGSGCIIVAVQTLNQIVTIDPATATVVGRFALARSNHPHGMYVDATSRQLFVTNEGNSTIEVVDLRTMEITDAQPVGRGPDVLALDPGLHRLYVATESGGLWVYHVAGKHLKAVGVLDLPNAHTVAVDPTTHLVYLPLQNLGGHPTLRILGARP